MQLSDVQMSVKSNFLSIMGCLRLFTLIWVARVSFPPASTSDRDYFNAVGPHPPDHLTAHMSELLTKNTWW